MADEKKPRSSMLLLPYERQTREQLPKGGYRIKRGTPFPDQAVNYLVLALKHNQLIVKQLSERVAANPALQINMTYYYFIEELVQPFLRQFKFMLNNVLAGLEQSSSLICTYFLQLGQLFWLTKHRDLESSYGAHEFNDALNDQIMDEIPKKPLQQYTQMDCINALQELTFVIKHVPATAQLDRLCLMVIVQACKYLMGEGGGRLFDGHADGNRMAVASSSVGENERYAASGRYILHLAVRSFYIFRNMRFRQLPSRELSVAEVNFITDYRLQDKIRKVVKESMVRNRELINQQKTALLNESRLSFGDRELNKIESPGQELVNDVIRNTHGSRAADILEKLADFAKLNIDNITAGVAGVDVAEQLIIQTFLSWVSGNDTQVPLQRGFVIHNSQMDSFGATAKIMDSVEPLMVQLDARYHLVDKRRRVNTRNVYEMCAAWLAIVYQQLNGIPEQSVGCLRNTYKELCGPDLKLPSAAVYIE